MILAHMFPSFLTNSSVEILKDIRHMVQFYVKLFANICIKVSACEEQLIVVRVLDGTLQDFIYVSGDANKHARV